MNKVKRNRVMSHTQSDLTPSLLDELEEVWPRHDWSNTEIRHGAFHTAVMLEDAVYRVRHGRNRRLAIYAEVAVMQKFSEFDLRGSTPRVIADGFHAAEWSAFGTTRLPGTPLVPTSWASDRHIILPLLDSLRSVEAHLDTGIPESPQWCGGRDFADLLEQLMEDIAPPVRASARDTVAMMFSMENDEMKLCHGDFGPHNILISDTGIGLIDPDNLCLGDEALDVAPLLGSYSTSDLKQDFSQELLQRAAAIKRALPLQVAVAADLAGDEGLRNHALNNFATRRGFRSAHAAS